MASATWRITDKNSVQVNLRSDDPDVVTPNAAMLDFQFRRSIPIPDDMVVNLSVSNAQIPYKDVQARITLKQTVQITFYVSIGVYGTVVGAQSAPPSGPWTMPLNVGDGVYYWVDVPPGNYTAQSFAWFIDTEVFRQTNNSFASAHPLNLLRDDYMTVANLAGKYWEPHKPHGINFAMNFCDNTYIGKIPRSPLVPSQPRLEQPIRLTYLSQLGNFVTQNPTGPNVTPWQGLPAGQQAHYTLDMPAGYWDVRAFAWWNDIQSYNLGITPGNAVSVMIAAYIASGGNITVAAINYMMNWCDNTYYYQGQIVCGGSGGVPGTIEDALPSINWATGAWSINAGKFSNAGIGHSATASCGLTDVIALDKVGGTPVAMTIESQLYMKTLLGVPLTGTLPTTSDINTWIGGTQAVAGLPAYVPGNAPRWPKIYAEGWDPWAPNPVTMGDPACGWCHYPDYPTNAGDDVVDYVQYVAGVPDNIPVAPNPDFPSMINSGEIKIGSVEDAIPSLDRATGAWSINCAKLEGGNLWTRGDITQAIVNLKTKTHPGLPIVYEDMTTETTEYMRKLLGVKDGVPLPTPGDITTFIGGNAVNAGSTGFPASPLPAPREYESPSSAVLYPKIYRYANWNLPAPYAEPTHSASLGNANPGCNSCFPLYPYKLKGQFNNNIYVRTNVITGSVDSNNNLHDNILCKIPVVPTSHFEHDDNEDPDNHPIEHIWYEGDTKYGSLIQAPFLNNIQIELVDHEGNAWEIPADTHYNISLLLQFIRRENPDQADPDFIETKRIHANDSATPVVSPAETDTKAVKKHMLTTKMLRRAMRWVPHI